MPFKPAGQLTWLEADQPFWLDVMREFKGAVRNVDPLVACLHAQVLLHCTDNVSSPLETGAAPGMQHLVPGMQPLL